MNCRTSCTLLLALSAAPLLRAGQRLHKPSVCPVDGKPVNRELYVDTVGLRLYACSEECLAKIESGKFAWAELLKDGRQPERAPIHRSREPATAEVLGNMVLIEGGEFVRSGNYHFRQEEKSFEGRQYTVAVSSFYMDKHEVTNEQYCEFLNDGNAAYRTPGYGVIKQDEQDRFIPARPGLAKMPAGCVNYYQAAGYAEWAGKRLPTEAEWKYAAGARRGYKYPWGNEEPGDTRANYGPSFGGRKPVGSFPDGRTPEGVFDLAGNIGEWCADFYAEEPYRTLPPNGPVKDPQGPASGSLRVYRLGCQCEKSKPLDLHATTRYACSPLRSASCVGIRCVRSK